MDKVLAIVKNQHVRDISVGLLVSSVAMPLDLFFPPADFLSYLLLVILSIVLLYGSFIFANYALYRRYGERVYLWRWYLILPLLTVDLVLSFVVARNHHYNYLSFAAFAIAILWWPIEKLGTLLGFITGVDWLWQKMAKSAEKPTPSTAKSQLAAPQNAKRRSHQKRKRH